MRSQIKMLRCLDKSCLEPYQEDSFSTSTSDEQAKVEKTVKRCYDYTRSFIELDKDVPKLLREKHKHYLKKGLVQVLPPSYQCLDSSRPWITYWISHSLAILEDQATLALASARVTHFLEKCSNENGGYGGGPGQVPHLATTYAAINALVTLCNEQALESINRSKLMQFLCDMKQTDGSFVMHKDGEVDVRGVYCAVSVATICGLKEPKMFEGTTEWIIKCQTYEGGFGGSPGNEAHGGYTFCALAALVLLGQAHRCDIKALLRWVANKQLSLEGGFAGRTNKLVDGCYSFWQGAVFPLIHAILMKTSPNIMPLDKWLFNQQALQEYLLCCCQESTGGMIDKPERHHDYYHTCYDLSGLALAQHCLAGQLVVGGVGDSNKVVPIHPVYNIHIDAVNFAKQFFEA